MRTARATQRNPISKKKKKTHTHTKEKKKERKKRRKRKKDAGRLPSRVQRGLGSASREDAMFLVRA